jgi:hypothetical protein
MAGHVLLEGVKETFLYFPLFFPPICIKSFEEMPITFYCVVGGFPEVWHSEAMFYLRAQMAFYS